MTKPRSTDKKTRGNVHAERTQYVTTIIADQLPDPEDLPGRQLSSYRERKARGDEGEQSGAKKFLQHGYEVSKIGQQAFGPIARKALRAHPNGLNYVPDYLVAQPDRCAMIDFKAKLDDSPSGWHYIEKNTVEAHQKMWLHLGIPTLYVIDGTDVLTPEEVIDYGVLRKGLRGGSGKPCWRVPASRARKFEEVFGDASQRRDAA